MVVVAIIALSALSALADEQYRTTIVNTLGSPVQINDCEARASDLANGVSPQAIPNFYLNLGVNFTNTSTKTLKDVQFGFTSFDASGSVLSSVHLAVSQDAAAGNVVMTPGAVTDLMGPKGWQGVNKPGKNHVTCAVERTDYSNGTAWVTPSPDPTAAPRQPSASPITVGDIKFIDDARTDFVSVNVTFTNEDTRTATAIRFSMIPYDAFGGTLWPTTQVADCIGTYSPGVRIDPSAKGCGVFGIYAIGKVVSVRVHVVSVVFSDGTQWMEQP
jgi:hypothetical protein